MQTRKVNNIQVIAPQAEAVHSNPDGAHPPGVVSCSQSSAGCSLAKQFQKGFCSR